MVDTKQLSDEQLDKVTGGSVGSDGIENNNQFSGFISMSTLKDCKYFNAEYYFVKGSLNNLIWFRGKLFNSYETMYCGTKSSLHDIYVSDEGTDSYTVGKIVSINADEYAAYTTKN